MTRTVTAMFDNRSDATNAVDRLIAAGITRNAIRILPENDTETSYESGSSYDAHRDDKGFWASLADIFMPNEDRYSYAEAMHRGSIMVSATVDDQMAEQAEDILEEYDGTVNMEDRVESWRREGWQGYSGASAASAGGFAEARGTSSMQSYDSAARTEREGVIPLAEEELQIGKREVGRGRVKVRSYVVERPVEEEVRLREEQLHVERRPVDRVLRAGDADELFQERDIEVEARGEEAIVNKTARVREEVAVGKTVEERTETVRDKVRRTEVEIDDDSSDTGGNRLNRR